MALPAIEVIDDIGNESPCETEVVDEESDVLDNSSDHQAGTSKRSIAWQFFTLIDKTNARCICGKICRTCSESGISGLPNLLKHIKLKHADELASKALQDNSGSRGNNSSNHQVGTSKRSIAWQFFTKIDKTNARCICGKICRTYTVSGISGLPNLLKHIKLKHADELASKALQDNSGNRGSQKPVSTPNNKRSAIWQYFELSPSDTSKASCTICKATYKRGTASLTHHLQTKHKALYEAAMKLKFENSTSNGDPNSVAVSDQPFSHDIFSSNFTFSSSRLVLKSLRTLTVAFNQYKLQVPLFLVDAFNLICYHVKTEGIFQVRGNLDRIKFMRYAFFGEFGVPEYCTLYDVCGLIEYFLSHLSEPLLPESTERQFLELSDSIENAHDLSPEFVRTLESMPIANKHVLIYLAVKFKVVAAHQAYNLVTISLIGNYFANAIFRNSKHEDRSRKSRAIVMCIGQTSLMLSQKKQPSSVLCRNNNDSSTLKEKEGRSRAPALRPLFPAVAKSLAISSLNSSALDSSLPVQDANDSVVSLQVHRSLSAPVENLAENCENEVHNVEPSVGEPCVVTPGISAPLAHGEAIGTEESTGKLSIGSQNDYGDRNMAIGVENVSKDVGVGNPNSRGHFICQYCSKTFHNAYLLSIHSRTKHPDFLKPSYFCSTCHFKTTTSSAMHLHRLSFQHKKRTRAAAAATSSPKIRSTIKNQVGLNKSKKAIDDSQTGLANLSEFMDQARLDELELPPPLEASSDSNVDERSDSAASTKRPRKPNRLFLNDNFV